MLRNETAKFSEKATVESGTIRRRSGTLRSPESTFLVFSNDCVLIGNEEGSKRYALKFLGTLCFGFRGRSGESRFSNGTFGNSSESCVSAFGS